MDGIDATAAVQVVGDLLQTILAAIQHYHLRARLDGRNQLLVILDAVVDEHHFLALVAGASSGGGGQTVMGRVPGRSGVLRIRGVGGLARRGIGDSGSDSAVEHHARFEGQSQGGTEIGLGRTAGYFILVRPEHAVRSLSVTLHCLNSPTMLFAFSYSENGFQPSARHQ
ncbi:hypothetical protein D9M68_343800 [compost metagenome]